MINRTYEMIKMIIREKLRKGLITKKEFNEEFKKSKKGETIIFDESGNIFGLDFIIDKTSRRECLLCKTNLDEDIGKGKWDIPLCKKHRMEELSKLAGYDLLPFGEKIRAREKVKNIRRDEKRGNRVR